MGNDCNCLEFNREDEIISDKKKRKKPYDFKITVKKT